MRRVGPLPTIADARAQGIKRIRIYCDDIKCFHSEVFDLISLGLPDSTPVVHIPRYRRFVCSKCGGRKIGIRFERPPAPGMPRYNGGRYPDEEN